MRVEIRKPLGALVAAAFFAACSGPKVNVAPVPPDSYSEVSRADGTACGMIFLWAIPIGVNDRVERAYAQALRQVRASSLTDTTVNESWYFGLVGTVVCTEVEGLALEKEEGPAPPPRARGELRKTF